MRLDERTTVCVVPGLAVDFQEFNLHTLEQPDPLHPRAVVYQYDTEHALNPRGLLMAYQEERQVKPVIVFVAQQQTHWPLSGSLNLKGLQRRTVSSSLSVAVACSPTWIAS